MQRYSVEKIMRIGETTKSSKHSRRHRNNKMTENGLAKELSCPDVVDILPNVMIDYYNYPQMSVWYLRSRLTIDSRANKHIVRRKINPILVDKALSDFDAQFGLGRSIREYRGGGGSGGCAYYQISDCDVLAKLEELKASTVDIEYYRLVEGLFKTYFESDDSPDRSVIWTEGSVPIEFPYCHDETINPSDMITVIMLLPERDDFSRRLVVEEDKSVKYDTSESGTEYGFLVYYIPRIEDLAIQMYHGCRVVLNMKEIRHMSGTCKIRIESSNPDPKQRAIFLFSHSNNAKKE